MVRDLLLSHEHKGGWNGFRRRDKTIAMRYKADITAGSLKVSESRIIADLLIKETDKEGWRQAIVQQNILQAKSLATATRLAKLIRSRLELMDAELWKLIRDGDKLVTTHAVMAAAVKHSPLLGDFLYLVVREQVRIFNTALSNQLWEDYLDGCRGRDEDMPQWNESTRLRLRSSIFQTLAQAGFIEDTKSLRLQPVYIAPQVIQYLEKRNEAYVLRCLQLTV